MYKQGVMAIGATLLFIGCAGNEGLILGEMTKKLLPDLQKEAKEKKVILLTGQKCLHKAKTIEKANICNMKIRQKDPDFEMEDFSQWTSKEKKEVDDIVQEHVMFLDCILVSKTISEATECKEP